MKNGVAERSSAPEREAHFICFATPSSNRLQYIPIIDVKPGDYLLSLNEETQKIEPHRINGLLDMGVKPVFKLTTESGRFIKTTGNHPYLVKDEGSRNLQVANGVTQAKACGYSSKWIKVSELNVGDEIAVPKSDSMEPIAALLDHRNTSKELFFSNPAKKIFDNRGDFANAQKIYPEKDNSAIGSSRITQNISKVGIAGNKYKGFSFYEFVDFMVRGIGFNVTDIHDFMAGILEDFSNRTGTVCVNENFHELRGRLDNQFLFVSQKSGIQHASLDIFCSNWAEFVFNLLKIHSGSQSFEYNMDRDTRTFNAGFSMLNFRVYTDVFVNHFFREHFSSSFIVLSKAYHILENLSSIAYADVTAPAPVSLRGAGGDEAISEIASAFGLALTNSNSDILWDRIVSIEYIGEEHVYDIEVEGTHNFIGNGIFAHNTYIDGNVTATGTISGTMNTAGGWTKSGSNVYVTTISDNVGIGTTGPEAKLEVVDSGANPLILYRTGNGVNYGTGINFYLQDSASAKQQYAAIYGNIATNTAGAEDGYLNFWTEKAGTLTEQMRITKDGNVGIGTTNPATALEVNGTLTVNNVSFNTLTSIISFPWDTTIGYMRSSPNFGIKYDAVGRTGGWYGTHDFYTGYNGAASTLAMRIKDGNVGIGTTGPNSKLDVAGDLRISGSSNVSLLFSPSTGSTKTGTWHQSVNSLVAGASGVADYMALDLTNGALALSGTGNTTIAGNVGIGTTGPGTTLEVSSGNAASSDGQETFRISNNVTFATLGSGPKTVFYGKNLGVNMAAIRGYNFGAGLSGLGFETGYGALTTKMVINETGNVGIGTTNPTSLLHLSAVSAGSSFRIISTTGTNAASMWVSNTGGNLYMGMEQSVGGAISVGSSAYAGVLSVDSARSLQFGTSNNIRATIDSTGNVGIGTTGPSYILSLGGDVARTIGMENSSIQGGGKSLTILAGGVQGGWNGENGGDLLLSSGSSIGNGSSNIYFKTATAGAYEYVRRTPDTKMTILGNGNVGIGTTVPGINRLYVQGGGNTLTTLYDTQTGSSNIVEFIGGSNYNYGVLGIVSGTGLAAGDVFSLGYSAGYNTLFTPVINWQSNGNVGIGTTGPVTKLDITGGGVGYPATSGTSQSAGHIVRFHDTTAAVLDIGGNGSNGFWLQSTDKNSLAANYPLMLNPNNGNVGIGTTGPGNSLHIYNSGTGVQTPLQVQIGASANDGTDKAFIGFAIGSAGDYGAKIGASRTATYGRADLLFYTSQTAATGDNSVERMRITNTGNVGIGTTNPGYKLEVNGSFYATSKSSSAKTSKGEFLFYAEEATDHRFEDFGIGQLSQGLARIELDPIYAESISDKKPYMVFVSLEDDCRGVYIAEKTPAYFLVKELNQGKSSAKFSWRIAGKRRGYEGVRLEPFKSSKLEKK